MVYVFLIFPESPTKYKCLCTKKGESPTGKNNDQTHMKMRNSVTWQFKITQQNLILENKLVTIK